MDVVYGQLKPKWPQIYKIVRPVEKGKTIKLDDGPIYNEEKLTIVGELVSCAEKLCILRSEL